MILTFATYAATLGISALGFLVGYTFGSISAMLSRTQGKATAATLPGKGIEHLHEET